jgi:hypothetical protein
VDIVRQIMHSGMYANTTQRQAWQKYWDALPDYYCGREEPGIAIVDVSGSMSGTPMEAAVSMGAYIAEHCKGPFQNHFITFSANPQLVEFTGTDIFAKVRSAIRADWGMNTNIEAVFDMLLDIGARNKVPQEEMPRTLYIFSDMEFDQAMTVGPVIEERLWGDRVRTLNERGINTLMEQQKVKWNRAGYQLPRLIFWNLRAARPNIPAIGDGFSYVSGFSPVMIENILSGKDGVDLMLSKLNSDRYDAIKSISEYSF